MADWSYTIWIIILPLLGFVIIGLGTGRIKPQIAGFLATVGIGISFFLSLLTAFQYFTQVVPGGEAYPKILALNTTWLKFNSQLQIDLGILLDPISVMMILVVTSVSLMVFIFSLGYMKGEEGFGRYFSFLSLFSFSMLGLVLAPNLFQLYMFWELVGVSSYLLIGFYYQRPEAVAASKKAFIVTRFADFGFLIGILLLSYTTGTFDLITLTDPQGPVLMQAGSVAFMGLSVISWSLILIFIGGAGKSAMFPLHIWLPDAMEGPTPVSALIHAATMVVAGVYLVGRLFPMFYFQAPEGLELIGFIGAFTSLFAAIIACTQTDIKRVLAYSTISQIGYMMLALGVSGYGPDSGQGYTASMFHLVTHAFFKALLFLVAGSVIHAVHSNSMEQMGNLRKHMPITHITCLIGCLAIAGIPPLSGFFSKDEILAAAYASNKLYFASGTLVAGLTAFYMFRLYFNVFWGQVREYSTAPKESEPSMTIPLILLAIGAALSGFIPFGEYVSADGLPLTTELHWNVALISSLVGLAGIIVAGYLYRTENDRSEKIKNSLGGIYQVALHKFYIDEVYLFVTKGILFRFISTPVAWFDRHIVDGFVNLVGLITESTSGRIKGIQSGQLQQYLFVFLSGVIILVLTAVYLSQN